MTQDKDLPWWRIARIWWWLAVVIVLIVLAVAASYPFFGHAADLPAPVDINKIHFAPIF